MQDPQWTMAGATFSHQHACKEFGLTEAEIFNAMNEGKLQFRENWFFGNSHGKTCGMSTYCGLVR